MCTNGDLLWDTWAHQFTEASHARRSTTTCAMSELVFEMLCALPMLHPRCSGLSSSSFLCCGLRSASASSHPLRLRHETFRRVRQPPAFELAVASADHTASVASPLTFAYRKSFSSSRVLSMSFLICTRTSFQQFHCFLSRFVRTQNSSMSFRLLTFTITSCFCCSLKRFMEARKSKRRHCSHRRQLSSSKCSRRINCFFST